MIRFWVEDKTSMDGRPFDLDKHDKAICDKWLDKIKQARDEIETETRIQVKHYTNTNAVIDEVLEVLDKLIEESEG